MARPPLPPFTLETATQMVRAAEDAWKTRDPERVAAAYTVASRSRNRAEFFQGNGHHRVLRRKPRMAVGLPHCMQHHPDLARDCDSGALESKVWHEP